MFKNLNYLQEFIKRMNKKKMKRKKHRILPWMVSLIIITSTLLYIGCSLDNKNPKPAPESSAPKTESSTGKNTNTQGTKPNTSLPGNPASLEGSTYTDSQGKVMIKDPESIMVLVNKKRNLSPDWVPDDLVIPNVNFANSGSEVKHMRKEAAGALEQLFSSAKKDNINLMAVSGYRSFSTQKRIFESNAKQYGDALANMTSARPGQSEHQTGLAMDLSCATLNGGLQESFGNTPEGQWVQKNAAEFGFIVRYLKGSENITGYNYEPWHIRYVGKEAAKYIMEKNITLEEYLGFKPV